MRFLCRTKVGFHSQVHLHSPAFKPAAFALGQFRRFGNLDHAEHSAVESPRRVFPICWHGELNMMNGQKRICHSDWPSGPRNLLLKNLTNGSPVVCSFFSSRTVQSQSPQAQNSVSL